MKPDKYKEEKMKKLTLFLPLFLILVILSFGSVSATDYTVSGNSFDDIKSNIDGARSGDQILLSNKMYTKSRIDSIEVNIDNITIKGQSPNSKAKLNGLRISSTIIVITANNIRLENLVFEKINVNVFGVGAIKSNGVNLTIINCEFRDNTAMNGAIILNTASTNTRIQNCIFTNNVATYSNSNGEGSGGAINTQSSYAQIINCTFINNYAIRGGGAISLIYGNNNTISGCTFNNNTATWGGAIYCDIFSTGLKISASAFNNNHASIGGAIYTTESVIIDCSNFISNSASYGGAIQSYNILNITGSTFNYNKAKDTGGALFSTNNVHINNSYFTGNVANDGGAIVSYILNIAGSTFNYNKATKIGGAVFSDVVNINNSYFTGNTGNNCGAIYSSNLTVDKTTFLSNQAKTDGGAIYSITIKSISGSSFLYNSANRGSAISVFESFKIYSNTFLNNKCGVDFKIELLPNYVQYGSSKVKITISRKDNVKLGSMYYPIYYSGFTPSYINNVMVSKDTSINDLSIKVNGINTKTKNRVTIVIVKTYPSYNWGDIVFTSSFSGNSEFIPCSGRLIVQVKILKTDAYNLDKNAKGKVSNKFFFPYRKDTIQTIYNGKIYTTTKGQYTSYNIYFLGGEKVSSTFQKYLVDHKFVADVNHTLIKNQIISILKLKKYNVKGLITQEKKGKVLYNWVKQHTKYELYSNTKYGAVGTLKNIQNKKPKHANCVDHTNLLVAMFRTVGIPIYYESWRIKKNDPNSGHLIANAHVNGKWLRLDATWKKSKWGITQWQQSGGKFRYSCILYPGTYLPARYTTANDES